MVAAAVCRLRNWTRSCQGRCCRSWGLFRSYASSSGTTASEGRQLLTFVSGLVSEGNTLRACPTTQKNRPVGRPHSAGIAICSPRGIGDPHDMRPRGSQPLSCAPICLRRGLPQGGGGWINISDFRARKSFPISDLRRRARRLLCERGGAMRASCRRGPENGARHRHALSTLFKRARATGAHQSARLGQMAGVGCCPSCINSSPGCR